MRNSIFVAISLTALATVLVLAATQAANAAVAKTPADAVKTCAVYDGKSYKAILLFDDEEKMCYSAVDYLVGKGWQIRAASEEEGSRRVFTVIHLTKP